MPHVVSCEYAFDGEAFVEGGAQVVVDGAEISAVRPRWAPCPPDWPVLDHSGCTLLPGLIDTHVHLVAGGEPDALALDAERSAADREQAVRRSLRQQLMR